MAARPAALLEQRGLVLAFDGQLVDRTRLVAALSPEEHGGQQATDAQLVLAAYRRWGHDAFERLQGDWALVLGDETRGRLVAARDPMGARLLHVFEDDGRVLIATTAAALLSDPRVPARLDDHGATRALVPYLQWSACTSTCYEGVQRIAPGTWRSWSGSSSRAGSFAALPATPGRALLDQQVVPALRSSLAAAIADRMQPGRTTGMLLSGGIDSGLIWGVAQAQRRRDPRRRLGAFAAIDALRGAGGDTPHVRAALAGGADLAHVLGVRAHHARARVRAHLREHATDPSVLVQAALRGTLAATAAEHGVSTLMTGIDGDLLFGAQNAELAEMLRTQGPVHALRALPRWAAGQGMPRWRLAWEGGLRPLLPRTWRRLLRRRRPIDRVGALIGPTFLSEATVRRFDVRGAVAHAYPDPPDGPHATAQTRRLHELRGSTLPAAAQRYASIGACFGLHMTHPYLDARVLSLASRLSPEQRRSVSRRPKGVLYTAGRGLLPRGVTRRTWASNPDHFMPDLHDRSSEAASLLLGDLGPIGRLLDVPRLRASAARLRERPTAGALDVLEPFANAVAVTRARVR